MADDHSQLQVALNKNLENDESRRAAAECGMDGFISKPINMEEVIDVIHSVFSKK